MGTLVRNSRLLTDLTYQFRLQHRQKICCFSRTKKNDRYFIDRLTHDEINLQAAKEIESIVYAGHRRRYGINIFTTITYLIGLLYWFIIPDLFKFLIARLLFYSVK